MVTPYNYLYVLSGHRRQPQGGLQHIVVTAARCQQQQAK